MKEKLVFTSAFPISFSPQLGFYLSFSVFGSEKLQLFQEKLPAFLLKKLLALLRFSVSFLGQLFLSAFSISFSYQLCLSAFSSDVFLPLFIAIVILLCGPPLVIDFV